jgi:hypothetical protein
MDGWHADDAWTVGDHGLLRTRGDAEYVFPRLLVGFFFRKSLKLAPGLRVNLSKRGAGLSAGPRGTKVSTNTRGERRASLSFKGLNWRKRF